MITRLTVTDFRAIRGTRNYELKPGVTALIGANERGKTSSVLALAYALYGAQAMPEGISTDDLINDHAKECSVTVAFTHNGDEYVLTRSQRRDGRGDATLTRNGQPLASGRAPVTQAVTDLFGVDHVGFLISVFARQDELDALAGKRGAERVSTVLRLLGVDQAEDAVKSIRKRANEERRALDLLRAGVADADDLNARLASDEKALAELREQHAVAFEEEGQAVWALDEQQDELDRLRPEREAFLAWQRQHDAAQVAASTARVRLEDAKRRIVVVPPEPEKVDGDLAEAQEAYEAQRAKWLSANDDLTRLRADLDSMVGVCPECHRPFDNAEELEAHRQQMAERITILEQQCAEAEREGQGALARRNAIAAYLTAKAAREDVIERNAAAQQEVDALTLAWQEARVAEETIGEPPEDPSDAITRLETSIATAQQEATKAKMRLATVEAAIAGTESSIERVKADLARMQERTDAIKDKECTVLTLDVAAKEMAAMKERLIGKVIPTLEERGSAIVADLTDGKHTELRLTADYEIQYVTETGQLRSFANLSGGAQDVFALALRLAIAELRAGKVSFLVLDEVFESMDDERQGLAWEAIERLSKRYEQVLVITHVAALRERAASVITL